MSSFVGNVSATVCSLSSSKKTTLRRHAAWKPIGGRAGKLQTPHCYSECLMITMKSQTLKQTQITKWMIVQGPGAVELASSNTSDSALCPSDRVHWGNLFTSEHLFTFLWKLVCSNFSANKAPACKRSGPFLTTASVVEDHCLASPSHTFASW